MEDDYYVIDNKNFAKRHLDNFASLRYTNYYRVFRKSCVFFTIYCNPFLACIAVRDLQSAQRNASLLSLLLAGNFLYNQ